MSHNISPQQLKKLRNDMLNCDCVVKAGKQRRITKIRFWLMEWECGDSPCLCIVTINEYLSCKY